jgi:hypothetical protein
MTELFTYIDLITGKYGARPEEQRIHIMDNAEMDAYCAWKARTKMVSDYKRYLALDKRAKIVNQNLMTRWDLQRELFRIYLRHAIKEEEFDQLYEDLKYYNKMDILEKRQQLINFVQHLEPRIVKRFDRNLNVVRVKTYNFPEHWRTCGYKPSFETLTNSKKRIYNAFVLYKYRCKTTCKKSVYNIKDGTHKHC